MASKYTRSFFAAVWRGSARHSDSTGCAFHHIAQQRKHQEDNVEFFRCLPASTSWTSALVPQFVWLQPQSVSTVAHGSRICCFCACIYGYTVWAVLCLSALIISKWGWIHLHTSPSRLFSLPGRWPCQYWRWILFLICISREEIVPPSELAFILYVLCVHMCTRECIWNTGFPKTSEI